jgi:phosphohistidine phosphatase
VNRLFLLRHAKAGWALPGVRDFDRPLDASGIADAEALGVAMRAASHVPDLTLCSNARRARETLEGVATHADTGRVVFTDALYSADAAGYLAIIRQNGALGSLMVVGHNPMMEDLTIAIAGSGDGEASETLTHGFPTSGLAVLRFADGLEKAAPGTGFLEAFLTPAALERGRPFQNR